MILMLSVLSLSLIGQSLPEMPATEREFINKNDDRAYSLYPKTIH